MVQGLVKLFSIKRSNGRSQLSKGSQARVQRLVGSQLIWSMLALPKAFAIQAYVPVAQIIHHKILDSSRCLGRSVRLVGLSHGLD